MTGWIMVRPNPSPFQQWWVLTIRVIAPTIRNGELLIAIAMSVAFTAGLYLPLNRIMATVVHVNYAQYLMPAIALQAVFFAAMSAALRSATDSVHGINRRFGAMPIPVMAPMAARMSGNIYRCAAALATAIPCGHVIGFRFYRSAEYTVGFCLLVLLIGIIVAVLGDLVGMASANPEATTHILLLPQIILMTLSVGFQPAELYPGWIQPFVRNQVFSQFVYALRALAGDATGAAASPSWPVVAPALVWLIGMSASAVLLYVVVRRRRR
jgi:ABC-2 type transport system permease protein